MTSTDQTIDERIYELKAKLSEVEKEQKSVEETRDIVAADMGSDVDGAAEHYEELRKQLDQLSGKSYGLRLALRRAEAEKRAAELAEHQEQVRGKNAEIASLVAQYNDKLTDMWGSATELADDIKAIREIWKRVRALRKSEGEDTTPRTGFFGGYDRYHRGPALQALRSHLFGLGVVDEELGQPGSDRSKESWLDAFEVKPNVASVLQIREPSADDEPLEAA